MINNKSKRFDYILMRDLFKRFSIFLVFVCLTACSHTSSSHTYTLSQTDSRLHDDALNIVGLFVQSLNERNFFMLQHTINQERMTFDGLHYIHSQRFLYSCIKMIDDMNLLLASSASFSLDDVDAVRSSALKAFRTFDSNSILVIAQIDFYNQLTNLSREVLFVVNRNDYRETQINAIYGLSGKPEQTEKFDPMREQRIVQEKFNPKYEIYHQLGICVNIPKDFILRPSNRIIDYYLNDKSGDEAAFQIFAIKSNDTRGESLKYIKQIVKSRDFYDFSIRLFHNGYRFKFYMDDGPTKVVIINAFRVKNRVIFMTFSAPKRFYDARQAEIDYCLDHVDFI